MFPAKFPGRCYTCCERIIPGDTVGCRRVRGGKVTECRACHRRALAAEAMRAESVRGAYAANRRVGGDIMDRS